MARDPRPLLSRTGFRRLKVVQAVSGLVFGTYLVAHAATLATAVHDPATFDATLAAVRSLTRRPWVEVLWIAGPVLVHGACAIGSFLQEASLRRVALAARDRAVAEGRLEAATAPAPFGRRAPTALVHRATGLALLLLVPLHALGMRLLPGLGGPVPDAAFLGRILSDRPGLTVAFASLVLAASYHAGYGVRMALINLGLLGPGRPRRLARWAGAIVGCALATGALAGVGALLLAA